MSTDARRLEVLHVEDDPATAQMYKLGLELAGYGVTVEPDAMAALRLTETCSFDLVLLDMHLPAMGGLELLERLRLREGNRELAVVILSNWNLDDSSLTRALELGILGCLMKSQTTPMVLVDHIRGWLQSSGLADLVRLRAAETANCINR